MRRSQRSLRCLLKAVPCSGRPNFPFRRRLASAAPAAAPELQAQKTSLSKQKTTVIVMDRDRYKAAFDFFDADGSGGITLSELREALKSVGLNPTEKEADELLKEADQDGDGVIGFVEFCVMVDKIRKDELKSKAGQDFGFKSKFDSNAAQLLADPLEFAEELKQSEIKDPELIFKIVMKSIRDKMGEENVCFPKDILWLAGAPGAGKGRQTAFIMQQRGITAPPLEVSTLLNSPEAKQMKESGQLVGDREVVQLLLEALLKPQFQRGVIVDGFPRTAVQAECIKLLFNEMRALSRKYQGGPLSHKFRRPIFHIMVLFVDEHESVRRQLARGRAAHQHNEIVKATGVGKLEPIRPTDVNEELARERYKQFKDQVYGSLQAIKERFHFHFVNAEGSVNEVQSRILQELAYQSALELGDETFEAIRKLPLATEVIQNARHELIRRLDHYAQHQRPLFMRVVDVLMNEFFPIITRQALSGKAIIRSDDPAFFEQDGLAIDMALDVLSERGYTVVLDYKKQWLAERVDEKGNVHYQQKRLLEFQIEFTKPNIRRG